MSLKKIASYISPTLREPEKCEACNQIFSCGASLFGCWCSKLKLSKETLEMLKSQYKKCLCPTCLEKLSIKNPN
jgi:hypothetical protein